MITNINIVNPAFDPTKPISINGFAFVPVITADHPDDVTFGVPEHLIEAALEITDKIDWDARHYISGETTDWDEGMACAAIFKAMLRAWVGQKK